MAHVGSAPRGQGARSGPTLTFPPMDMLESAQAHSVQAGAAMAVLLQTWKLKFEPRTFVK